MASFVRTENEEFYLDPHSKLTSTNQKLIRRRFPDIDSPPTLDLTVVVPAKNEETRLPWMLEESLAYLEQRSRDDPTFTWEIIIVDDGSTDMTSELGLEYSDKYSTEKIRVLTLDYNRGKGGAVRLGVLSARGRQILFADADGATKFPDLAKLEAELNKAGDNPTVVCGSRAHLEKDSIAKRSILRTILMYGFHLFVMVFGGVQNVKDTQCGFKLFSRNAAKVLFKSMHIERWAFDVELLFLAQKLGMTVREVPVNWREVDGSKLSPLQASVQMGCDIFIIWLKYFLGIWKVEEQGRSRHE